MRGFLLSVAGLTLLSSGALAADLEVSEAAPVVAVPAFTWTGAYVGVQAGYSWGHAKTNDPLDGRFRVKQTGVIVGGFAGYNVQIENSPVVLGVETDFNWSDADGKSSQGSADYKLDERWTGATRGRVGYAFDRALVYGAAGVAYERRELNVGGEKPKKTTYGWAVGGGVESALTDNVIIRAEYRYSDFGRKTFENFGFRTRQELKEHRVMGGVAYKFGW